MGNLSHSDQRLYERLSTDCSMTAQGRVKRAIPLIRKGWCDCRAYDTYFEMWDGDEVLSGLMCHVKQREPELRAMMTAQGFWSGYFDNWLNCPVRSKTLRPVTGDARQLNLF